MTFSVPAAWCAAAAFALGVVGADQAAATDLYRPNNWSSLASDRLAERVGDTLTVVIYESSSATNTAQTGSRKSHRLSGEAGTGGGSGDSAHLDLSGQYDGSGQTGRSGKLLAQIDRKSVV